MDFTILKTLRKGQGLKLKDLALKIGITEAYLSGIERNKKNPTFKVIEKLCKELGLELNFKIPNKYSLEEICNAAIIQSSNI